MSQIWDVKMLKSVHLVGENETEDLYAGFEEEYNPAYDTEVCLLFIFIHCYLNLCVGE